MKYSIIWFLGVGVALAGSLGDYQSMFDSAPCSDGWAMCVQDGELVEVGTVVDENRIPHRNDARISFFSFKPLPNSSPFVSFEAFPEAEEPDPEPEEPVVSAPTAEPTSRPQPTRTKTKVESKPDPKPVVVAEPEVVPEPEIVVPDDPLPPPPAAGCDDLGPLESASLLGALTSAQQECLEKRIGSSEPLTQQSKVSKILINNAKQAKKYSQWENHVKRHLEKLDRSDANLLYGISVFLYRKKKYSDTIKWSERALEQKATFSAGSDYKKKVYQLYQLRTMAANKLWQINDKKTVKLEDDAEREKFEKASEKYKGKTKNFAREWLDYARASGQSQSAPMQICVSAADKGFCQ